MVLLVWFRLVRLRVRRFQVVVHRHSARGWECPTLSDHSLARGPQHGIEFNASGKFVFLASVAYLVENGEVLYPVKGAALVVSGPECLKLVSGVGTCGKEGQSVLVAAANHACCPKQPVR